MSLINDNIMKELSAWAEENGNQNIFPKISQGEDSYYVNRNSENTYMMEYSFETIYELKKSLEEYSGLSDESQMLKVLTLGIMQNRYKNELEINGGNVRNVKPDAEKILPDFVYVF